MFVHLKKMGVFPSLLNKEETTEYYCEVSNYQVLINFTKFTVDNLIWNMVLSKTKLYFLMNLMHFMYSISTFLFT